jgi:hypothetical protein
LFLPRTRENLHEIAQYAHLRCGDVGDALDLSSAGTGVTVAVAGLAGVAETVLTAGREKGVRFINSHAVNEPAPFFREDASLFVKSGDSCTFVAC